MEPKKGYKPDSEPKPHGGTAESGNATQNLETQLPLVGGKISKTD
jgi:hypothetical protein